MTFGCHNNVLPSGKAFASHASPEQLYSQTRDLQLRQELPGTPPSHLENGLCLHCIYANPKNPGHGFASAKRLLLCSGTASRSRAESEFGTIRQKPEIKRHTAARRSNWSHFSLSSTWWTSGQQKGSSWATFFAGSFQEQVASCDIMKRPRAMPCLLLLLSFLAGECQLVSADRKFVTCKQERFV